MHKLPTSAPRLKSWRSRWQKGSKRRETRSYMRDSLCQPGSLLYQQSACAPFKVVLSTTWRNYGSAQSRGALQAAMVIFVHIASVCVPFSSESKIARSEERRVGKECRL